MELFKLQTISRKSKDPINLNDSQRSSYTNQYSFDKMLANKFKPTRASLTIEICDFSKQH